MTAGERARRRISAVHSSRRPLGGLLRMRFFLNDTIGLPHPEEACAARRLEGRTFVKQHNLKRPLFAALAAHRRSRQNSCRSGRGTPMQELSPLAIYQAHLDRAELAYQWSPAAGRAVFYPRLVCPYSGSTALEWRGASGLRTVHATTVTHPAQGDPYNVAPLDFDEGFRLMSPGEDID